MYFPEFKIDTFFITALLTILGYSINDTIVVFDRIRSNLKKLVKKESLKDIIELSINDTLRRSIFTSLTLFFVLLTIFLFGPESIKGFVLVMMFGTLIGTYSSIFIASPLLFELNKKKKISEYKDTSLTPDDKIVV
jgi:preprotein translocase SecF subunit